MNPLRIIQCLPGDEEFHFFEKLPQLLYAPYTRTASDINNELLHTCLVVMSGQDVRARLAVYFNSLLRIAEQPVAIIGNYECVEDDEASAMLLLAAEKIIARNGYHQIIGPMNGSTWDSYRFKDSASPAFLSETQNHLYYTTQFANAGYQPLATYVSSQRTIPESDDVKLTRQHEELLKHEVTFRPIQLDQFEQELARIFDFNLIGFSTNEFYTPISRQRFIEKYLEIKQIIDPQFVLLADGPSGDLLGYVFCLKNRMNTTTNELIIKTAARHPSPLWRGLGQVMNQLLMQKARAAGFISVIHAYMFDQGTSAPVSRHLEAEPFAHYTLYQKNIIT